MNIINISLYIQVNKPERPEMQIRNRENVENNNLLTFPENADRTSSNVCNTDVAFPRKPRGTECKWMNRNGVMKGGSHDKQMPRGTNWPDVICAIQFLYADVSRSSWHNSRLDSGVIQSSSSIHINAPEHKSCIFKSITNDNIISVWNATCSKLHAYSNCYFRFGISTIF